MESPLDIQALKAHDEPAFRTMVELFQDRVFNTCYGFFGNREEAEDAAQETFIAIYKSIGGFREEAQLSTWVYRIAVTTSLQALRRKKMKKRFALFFSRDGSDEDEGASDEAEQPLAILEQKERAEVLALAMNKLTESQRVAFTLHKVEGLEYKEIADIMNVSLSSVESLIHRATKNLRVSLDNYYRSRM